MKSLQSVTRLRVVKTNARRQTGPIDNGGGVDGHTRAGNDCTTGTNPAEPVEREKAESGDG